jgi:hypothetical protein
MSDLSNDTKKHTTKSRETIPLNNLPESLVMQVRKTNLVKQHTRSNYSQVKPPTLSEFPSFLPTNATIIVRITKNHIRPKFLHFERPV